MPDDRDGPTGAQLPDPCRAVLADADGAPPVGGDRHVVDDGRVAAQLAALRGERGPPDPSGAVGARREHSRAAAEERGVPDAAAMPAQRLEQTAVGEVPQTRGTVAAGGEQPRPIGAERDRVRGPRGWGSERRWAPVSRSTIPTRPPSSARAAVRPSGPNATAPPVAAPAKACSRRPVCASRIRTRPPVSAVVASRRPPGPSTTRNAICRTRASGASVRASQTPTSPWPSREGSAAIAIRHPSGLTASSVTC